MVDSEKVVQNICQTCCEMLNDRHFIIDKNYRDISDMNKIRERLSKQIMFIARRIIDESSVVPHSKVLVFFCSEPNVRVATARIIKSKLDKHKSKHGIIVYPEKITHQCRTTFDKSYCIEYFKAIELVVNKSRHQLIPKHEMMTEEEVSEFMSKHKIRSKNEMPKIHVTDWMVRYFNAPVGSCIKITRIWGNQQEAEIYVRVVYNS